MNKQIINTIKYISEKFYVIIFVIIIGVGLIFSIIILTDILNKSSLDVDGSDKDIITFNQSAVDKLKNFNTSDKNTVDISSLSGRVNPFNE